MAGGGFTLEEAAAIAWDLDVGIARPLPAFATRKSTIGSTTDGAKLSA
jgi:hypothetical protein